MKTTNDNPLPRVTLKDVAKASGYSINTISRAMRDDNRLTKATREKIQAIARRLGYVPNMLASTLRSGTSRLVAVIVNDLHNQHFTIMLNKIDKALRAAGYTMMVLCMQLDESLGEKLIQTAISHQVDGILYFPYHNSPNHAEYMARYNMPFVLIDRWIQGIDADSVRCDDQMGGYIAAKHLIDLGHRRFLRLAGVLTSSSEIDRSEGFYRALKEAKLNNDCVRVIPWEESEEAIAQNNYARLLRPLDYTAVFSFSDELAYHALKAFSLLGVHIPENVSIISFDHICSEIPYLSELTSIYTSQRDDIANTAVDMLLKRIANPNMDTQHKIFSVVINDGGTTAPLRQDLSQ
ncbi:MAG: LacI family transcriptional regulator [Clostridiales bacterium]|nr:LacI family transcriptional regulator [Clostridiales bacterium]